MPVAWEALDELRSGAQWTITNAREHLSFQREDPWQAYWTTRQGLSGPLKALGLTTATKRKKRVTAGA
jgi:bifunctional non-homologous end joining protein LigD